MGHEREELSSRSETLERRSGGGGSSASSDASDRDHNLDSVARAERELLQALESIR
ncbi:hypothetical protein CCP2SC5_100027 [Azospirillaceae bacterium]